MAKSLTPREQIERIADILRRATRYMWLVVVVTVVGGGLSVLFALSRPQQFESETVLLYREMISQSVLQGREVMQSANVLSSRFKEMVLARSNLVETIRKFKLLPDVVEGEGEIAASDELRQRVSFRDKGAGTFRIAYKGDTPEEAQKVTQFLAERLKAQDNKLRREQAEQTKNFLAAQKDQASQELRKRERELAVFLQRHPEFAEDGTGGGGAGVRAASAKKAAGGGGDPKLSALERQRRRIQIRLANPDAPVPVAREAAPEPGELRDARREVERATASLAEKTSQFTDRHPDVVAARRELEASQARLRRIEAGLPASPSDNDVVAQPVDKAALQRELDKVEREIASYRARKGSEDAAAATKSSQVADDVVSLETEWAKVQRAVEESRERADSLEARVFTADITASSEFAEAAQLAVIDDAYVPVEPAGKPRKLLAIAGTAAFAGLGLALALGLALIDDRIYRRADLDRLGVATVLMEIPPERKGRRRA
jgi:polysaccharide biosynthesis transport protein